MRVASPGGVSRDSSLLCGIDWVTANAATIDVANLSLGGIGVDSSSCGAPIGDLVHMAVCRSVQAGVTYVVAAGNDAEDAAGQFPAAYDEVITVSAMVDTDGLPGGQGPDSCNGRADDTLAPWSNFGADVDLAAPGDCVLFNLDQ